MGSLNEGVELDNEVIQPEKEAGKEFDQVVFQEVIPGEVPELNEDLDISALVTKQRGLDYLQATLESVGGMNQQLAMESVSLVPKLISDECPLAFYSQDITKTRYSFALEAIAMEKESVGDKIKDAISKIIAFVREQLSKLMQWLETKLQEFRGKQPPAPKPKFGEDRRAMYISVFGKDAGDKLAIELADALESRDKRIEFVKSAAAADFYFVSAYRKTAFFNQTTSNLKNFVKHTLDVASEAEKYNRELQSNVIDDASRVKSIKKLIDVGQEFIDFFRESSQHDRQGEVLTDSEKAGLNYDKAFAIFELVNNSMTKYCEPLMNGIKQIENILSVLMSNMVSSESGDPIVEGDRVFTQLLKNHAMAAREILTEIYRWTTSCVDAAHRLHQAYGSDTFNTQESNACKKLGLDYSKIE